MRLPLHAIIPMWSPVTFLTLYSVCVLFHFNSGILYDNVVGSTLYSWFVHGWCNKTNVSLSDVLNLRFNEAKIFSTRVTM